MGDRNRVLVLNHFAAPPGQAGGTRHVELFGRLAGWEYAILAGNRNYLSGLPVDAAMGFIPVPVTAYTSNGLTRIANWMSFAVTAFFKGAGLGNVDVVYASSPHLLAALSGWVLSLVKRARFVLEVRDLWPQVLVDMGQLKERSAIYRLLSALELFLYARARRIVVMAEGSRSALKDRGISAEKILYIPNGADPEDFIPSASRESLRDFYGFRKFTAIYAGAHGPANGLDLLLDAAETLQHWPLDIVLVGGGVAKARLIADAEARGLTNVRFMAPVAKTEIPDLLSAADIGLHILADVELFRTAVSPNKVFDYMAAGLPVLTNCPGLVSQLVAEAGCGVMAEPDQIAAALAPLTSGDPEELVAMGLNGANWIRAHQSRTAMAERLGRLLSEVVEE